MLKNSTRNCGVELQERAQQVDFVPGTVVLHRPRFGILEWVENVVDVDQHAGRQQRQYAEQQIGHVAAGLGDVGGLQAQQIAAPQRREYLIRDLARTPRLHALAIRIVRCEQRKYDIGARIVDRQLHRMLEEIIVYVHDQQGREAAAELDAARRLVLHQHGEQDCAVGVAEVAVAGVVAPLRRGAGGEGKPRSSSRPASPAAAPSFSRRWPGPPAPDNASRFRFPDCRTSGSLGSVMGE